MRSYWAILMSLQEHVSNTIINEGAVLSMEHQRGLCQEFTGEDVWQALNEIEDTKAPALDGYNNHFFKKAWGCVGPDIIDVVLEFFQSGKILKQINATTLCLIPKCSQPEDVTQFRPIACCNVVYQIISKMICSRLKKVLPDIVDSAQSAFVESRVIMHNIIVCQDMLKHYKRKNGAARCTLKIDLKKAYDSVNWEFIRNLLKALRFPSMFVKWIMNCLTTPFSLSINGGLIGFFSGKKGLRQGDPVSPLVFVLVMEYFTRILKKTSKKRNFRIIISVKK